MSVSQSTRASKPYTLLEEGTYLTDGENLYWIVGYTRLGSLVEDCRTGDVRWKHIRLIEEMEVIIPNESRLR